MQFLLAVEWTHQWWAACVCPCWPVVGTGWALGSLIAVGDLLQSVSTSEEGLGSSPHLTLMPLAGLLCTLSVVSATSFYAGKAEPILSGAQVNCVPDGSVCLHGHSLFLCSLCHLAAFLEVAPPF